MTGHWLGAWLLLLSAALSGRADTVVLKNGDRLTGTLLGVVEGKVILQTDYAGELRIDWKAIAEYNGKKAGATPPASVAALQGEPAKPKQGFQRDRFTLNADLNQEYSFQDASYKFSLHADSAYIGTAKWDGFLFSHTDLDDSSTSQTVTALVSVNRYLTRHFFLFPEYDVVHLTKDPPYRVDAQYAGGGAGWAFLRKKDEQVYLRSGFYAVKASGVLATLSGPQPIGNPPAAWSLSAIGKTKPLPWLEVSGTFDFYKALAAGTQPKLFFDTTARIPITGNLTLDLRVYDPPDITRAGIFSIRDSKFSSGFGYSF